jgi:hypothetical protein
MWWPTIGGRREESRSAYEISPRSWVGELHRNTTAEKKRHFHLELSLLMLDQNPSTGLDPGPPGRSSGARVFHERVSPPGPVPADLIKARLEVPKTLFFVLMGTGIKSRQATNCKICRDHT